MKENNKYRKIKLFAAGSVFVGAMFLFGLGTLNKTMAAIVRDGDCDYDTATDILTIKNNTIGTGGDKVNVEGFVYFGEISAWSKAVKFIDEDPAQTDVVTYNLSSYWRGMPAFEDRKIFVKRTGNSDCYTWLTNGTPFGPNVNGYSHILSVSSVDEDCKITLKNGCLGNIEFRWSGTVFKKVVYTLTVDGNGDPYWTGYGFGTGQETIPINLDPGPHSVEVEMLLGGPAHANPKWTSHINGPPVGTDCSNVGNPDVSQTPKDPSCKEICGDETGSNLTDCCNCVCGNPDCSCPAGDDGEDDCSETYTGNLWTEVGCITPSDNGIVVAVMRVFVGIVTGLSVVRFIQAGYMINTDDPEKMKEARGIVTSAVIAIAFGIMLPILLNFIGIDILGIGKIFE
ncbi:MAG: pilin [Candidatus Dojkabacteria bacterium]|nr:pilin [Candidatus Dojkabacteria bacterium]